MQSRHYSSIHYLPDSLIPVGIAGNCQEFKELV